MSNLIIDFDSTISAVELLPEIFKVALQGNENAEQIQEKIDSLTTQGMNGEISFSESLRQRVELLPLTKDLVKLMVDHISANISPSFRGCVDELNKHNLHIISGAFSDVIVPIMAEYGVFPYQIHANKFVFDEDGKFTGIDMHSLLTKDDGKVQMARNLDLVGDTVVIGDGMTDHQIREQGVADLFIYYAEHVKRDKVMALADFVANDFNEVVDILNRQ